MDFQERRAKLLKETKEKIAFSVNVDNFITQAVDAIGEIDRAANILAKRLREWFELYNPELSHKERDHEALVKKILLNDISKKDDSMGGNLEKEDLDEIQSFAKKLDLLYEEKERLVDYIRKKMEVHCSNILEITGPLIGAKLLAHKGTLKELAFMPASTIQLIGAEKALFRHIRSNAKSPKYGFILQHQFVSTAENKGKAARQLANKISLAAKKDYFSKMENTKEQ